MGDYLKLAVHKNAAEEYRRTKELRKQAPLAERMLWNKLQSLPQETNIRFRRQHPLRPYIADFVCLKAKLVIELDGLSHDSRQQQDHERDTYIKSLGYTIAHFGNDEILENAEGIATTILNMAQKLLYTPLPQPLPQGEGSLLDVCSKEHT